MNASIVIAVGVAIFTSFVGWCSYDYGYNSALSEKINSYEKQAISLKKQFADAVERERKSYEKQEKLEADYIAKIQELRQNETSIINEYHANNLRLRDPLKVKQCPDVSSIVSTTSDNYATTTGGLHDRDVEFLIRYAARADAVAEQLKSAQALIKQDRELCNGQTDISNIPEKIVSQGTSRGAPQAGAKTSPLFISA